MNLDDENDEQLVHHFKHGDQRAFDVFVRRFQDRIFRLASINLFDEQLAADVTQEVFLRSYKGLHRFRFRSTVFTWLYRTTRNVCHEFNRRRRNESVDVEPICEAPGPADLARHAETTRSVRQLVAALPPRQQEVVMLRIFEDLSVKECAKAMRCREGTVKALLSKAKDHLHRDFNHQENLL